MANLFTPVVPPAKQHPIFAAMASRDPQYEPTRLMMEEVFARFELVDRNFIEQF